MIWEQNTATIVMVTNLKERKEVGHDKIGFMYHFMLHVLYDIILSIICINEFGKWAFQLFFLIVP